jgi:hypothetical protein
MEPAEPIGAAVGGDASGEERGSDAGQGETPDQLEVAAAEALARGEPLRGESLDPRDALADAAGPILRLIFVCFVCLAGG